MSAADPGAEQTGEEGGSTGDPGGSTAPAAGGGGSDETVRVGLVAEPASLDFTTTGGAAIPQILMDNIYETLVRIDEGEIVPGLADSWEVSEDRLTYTFTLEEGVTFSDGSEFTAEDAAFSLDRVSSDAWTISLKSQLDVVESVEAVDDTTLEVTLSRPSNAFLYALTTRVGAMFDTEAVDNRTGSAITQTTLALQHYREGDLTMAAQAQEAAGEATTPAALPGEGGD